MFDTTIYQTPEYFGYDLLNNKTAMMNEIRLWQGENPYTAEAGQDARIILRLDCPQWIIVQTFYDYNMAIYRQDQPEPDYIVVGPPTNGQYEVVGAYNLFDARFPTYEEAHDFIMCLT